MTEMTAYSRALARATQYTARMMIACYVLARSLGLAGESPTDRLVPSMQLPGTYVEAVAQAVLVVLGLALMLGVQVRLSALLLGLHLFWTSFVLSMLSGEAAQIDAFWRDLTLTAALALVASGELAQTRPRADNPVRPRRVECRAEAVVRRMRPALTLTLPQPSRSDFPGVTA